MHKVKCKYCEIIFDADQEPYVYIESSRRYAHKNCYENFTSQLTQNEKDYLELEKYIKKLFGKDYVNAKIMNQIQSYKQTYGYTYSGIYKCLQWWFEIKKHPIEDANDGIGIVPFIYEEVFDYYHRLWLAHEANSIYDIKKYNPKKKEVIIPPPSISQKSSHKEFKLLEEEE